MADDRLKYMPFFGRDFYNHRFVQKLTDRQETWYMRLLWYQWENKVVPLDEQLCRSIARPEFGTTAEEWYQFHQSLPEVFVPIDETGFEGRNEKVEEVRVKSLEVIEAKRRGGQMTAELNKQRAAERKAIEENAPNLRSA